MRDFPKNLLLRIYDFFHIAKKWIRLRHTILACALASILITEFVILGVSYVLWSHEQIDQLYEETLLMLKANVDSASFLSLDETVKMGERIAAFSNVRGGAIYNRIGEQIAAFGQPPGISMRSFQRDGIHYLSSPDESYLDIYYPVEATGLANPIILRIDVHNVPALLKQRLEEKATTTLSIAFISGLAIVFLLNLTVVRPILKLRNAILSATDNLNEANHARLNWNRGDEFGDVAKALDMLFTTVSIVSQEDLSAGQEARLQSAFPVLTYDAAWHLINANTAALSLFTAASLNDLIEKHENFIRRKNETGEQDVPPKELVHRENLSKIVNVITPSGIKRCIMNAVVVQKRTGAVLRTIITLVDITRLSTQIENLNKKSKDLESEKESLSSGLIVTKRRLAEMRSLFQSCLILLTNTQKLSRIGASQQNESHDISDSEGVDQDRAVVLTDKVVNAWFASAHANHLIDSELTYSALPAVYGRPTEIEAVFGQALMAVYALAPYEKPSLRIKADINENQKVFFEIWPEKANSAAKTRHFDQTLAAGAQLAIASLRSELNALGGLLHEAEKDRIVFSLDAALADNAGEDLTHGEGEKPSHLSAGLKTSKL
jgi:hypothetical protein